MSTTAEPLHEVLVPRRELTWEDLQVIDDHGYWAYELVDGKLIMSPAPSSRHQSCVLTLAAQLREACPADLKTFVAPFDYTPRPGDVLQPDVLVARRADVGEQRLVAPPVLAVEVLSRSSRSTDRSLKRFIYEETGVAHYWIVDPEAPSVTLLELREGAYVETATVRGSDVLHVTSPVALDLVARDLLDE